MEDINVVVGDAGNRHVLDNACICTLWVVEVGCQL